TATVGVLDVRKRKSGRCGAGNVHAVSLPLVGRRANGGRHLDAHLGTGTGGDDHIRGLDGDECAATEVEVEAAQAIGGRGSVNSTADSNATELSDGERGGHPGR